MQRNDTSIDLTTIVHQARQQRDRAVADMIAAGVRGARRIATNLLARSSTTRGGAASPEAH